MQGLEGSIALLAPHVEGERRDCVPDPGVLRPFGLCLDTLRTLSN
jgi:hypothetical protein